jgi:hypothetical protein
MGLKVKDGNGVWQDIQDARLKESDTTWVGAKQIGWAKDNLGVWLPVTFFLEEGAFIRYDYMCQQSGGENTGVQLRREITSDGVGGEVQGVWVNIGINYTACPAAPTAVTLQITQDEASRFLVQALANIGVAQDSIEVSITYTGQDATQSWGSTVLTIPIGSSVSNIHTMGAIPAGSASGRVEITAVDPATIGGTGTIYNF